MKLVGKLIAVMIVAALAAVIGFHLGSTSTPGTGAAAASKSEQLWTCGMHPQVIQNKPGLCPICEMKLTPIRREASGSGEKKPKYYKSTMNAGETSPTPAKDSMGMDMVPVYEAESANSTISIDPVTVQNMGLRLGTVSSGPVRRVVRTVGAVEFAETSLTDVNTKVKGWIEKLYVDSTGQQVHRGEPLFEFYSPDLYSAQTEYLLALDSGDSLKASARNKLKYYDISDEQIAELEKTKQVKKTLRVLAPRDGIVVEKMAVEGQMVEAGMKLYRLADLSLVWVQSQVYEQDLGFVRPGEEATVSLSYLPDRKFRGRVTYIYPTIDDRTRTARVRMEFHNPGYFLKPGMFTTVELESEVTASAVLVPDSAVLRSGEKNTVFVALDGGHFEPRVVTLGMRSEGNTYQVLRGLKAGERVVVSGQFMLDSESQLREAIQKMGQPGKSESDLKSESTKTDLGTNAETVVYICPMPEHVSIQYDHPGQCPLCGMSLVPVSDSLLAKIRPGASIDYFTCPMPEHSDVHESKPGKCPKCGMTLIPVTKAPAVSPKPEESASTAPAAVTLYTCPMAEHADVVADKPGKCPKCGMKLVETSQVDHGKEAEKHWAEQHPSTLKP